MGAGKLTTSKPFMNGVLFVCGLVAVSHYHGDTETEMIRIVYAGAGLVAGLAMGLAGSAGASPARAYDLTCHTPVPSGATRHVVDSGQSLAAWAGEHAYGVANVLSATITCGPGIVQGRLESYLNGADMSAPLPEGTVLWVPFSVYHK
jgi:hypothetical protein